MNTFFLDRLNSEPHALAFAGQSTPWPVTLADQSANPVLNEALHTHADAAQALLYPVSADLLATTGRPVDLFGFEPNPARLGAAAAASASVPGIALAQLGALLDAASLGYNPAVAKPVAVLGHSQGVLAVHMVQAIVEAGSIEAASAQIDEILGDCHADRRCRHPSGASAWPCRTSRRSHADAVCQGHHPRPGGCADQACFRCPRPDRRGSHQFRHALCALRLPGGSGRVRRGSGEGAQAPGQAARREGAWRSRVRTGARIP